MKMHVRILVLMTLGSAISSKKSLNWRSYNCDEVDITTNDVDNDGSENVLLDATGKFIKAGVTRCVAIRDKTYGKFQNYEISVAMLNVASSRGVNFGHLGIVFNFIDESNYDYIYLR